MNRGTVIVAKSLALSGLVAAALASAAGAQVSCGDTITEKVVMDANLSCGASNPALTIDGGSLDMNGKRITGCLGDGILLIGEKSSVSNGSVVGCTIGFRIEGTGGHNLKDVVAIANSDHGFAAIAGSVKNKFSNAHAIDNGNDGFTSDGPAASFTACIALGNAVDGFDVHGESTKFKDCLANDNDGDGFETLGTVAASFAGCQADGNTQTGFRVGNDSKVKGCTASGNQLSGFDLGTGAKVSGATSSLNLQHGFRISSGSIAKSLASRNGADGVNIVGGGAVKLNKLVIADSTDDGIQILAGAGHSISGCSISLSGQFGIQNAAATDMKISNNLVVRSGDTHLQEDVASCGTNSWSKNKFGSSNQVCVE